MNPRSPSAAKERAERLLRAIGVADRASTSMTPYGPMNDKWMCAFLDALAAEGLAIVPVAADRLPDPADCPTCHGASTADPDPDCPTCEGHGEVSVPAAVSPAEPPEAAQPLSHVEVDLLARYNAEVYRGLAHNDRWKARMAELQHRYYTAGWTPRRRGKLRVGG